MTPNPPSCTGRRGPSVLSCSTPLARNRCYGPFANTLMLRTLRIICTVNLPLAITVLAAYIIYGLASGAPIGEHFFGMVPGRLGRGAGAIYPPWTWYALTQGLVMFLFICERLLQLDSHSDRVFCLIFTTLFLVSLLIEHLPHRVIFPEDVKVKVIPGREQVLMWYLFCSNGIYGLFGSNDD